MSWKERAQIVDQSQPSSVAQNKPSWVDRAKQAEPQTKEQPPETDLGDKVQTFANQASNALTFGYLPQLRAVAERAMFPVLNYLTDSNVEPDSYVDARDKAAAEMAQEAQRNPKSAMAGTITGSLMGAAIPGAGLGMGAAKGIGGAIARGAAYGAASGALANPGDVKGEIDPLQLEQRAKNAQTGALIGAASGGASQVAAKGFDKLADLSSQLRKYAETKAFKGSGAMLKDFRTAADKGEVEKVGRYMLDNKIIQAGDTFDDVAKKAALANQAAGQELNAIYAPIEQKLADPSFTNRLTANQLESVKNAGFNPVRDKVAILEKAKEALGAATDRKQALSKLSSYIDDLAEQHGDQVLSPWAANEVKGALDQSINYSRRSLAREPGLETAYHAARTAINDKVAKGVAEVGKLTGDQELAKKLIEANQKYGITKKIKDIAEDRISRENANAMFGLRDTLAGSFGGAAGGLIGEATGSGHKDAGMGAAGGALLGAIGSKMGRKYGSGVLATGADKLAIPAQMIQPIGRAGQMISPDVLSRGLTNIYNVEKSTSGWGK